MKKLFLINVSCNKGSTGRIAEQIGNVAKDGGWDVYFAHGSRYIAKSQLKTIKFGSKAQDYFHALFYDKILGRGGLGSKVATRALIRQIDSISPDIIHLHNIHGYYLNYKILFEYLNSKKIRIVWTLHDCWCFTGGCTFLNYMKCEQWKTGCGSCPLKGDFPRHPLINRRRFSFDLKKRLFSRYDNITLVPVSYWLEGLVKRSFFATSNVLTIHNGVDINVFKPYDSGDYVFEKYLIPHKRIVLGVASPWSARKGLNDFIKLSENLSEDYHIVLVGLSKKQIDKLPNRVTGIKRTDSAEELAKLYSAATVYVNPTYSDNFPTTNIESLASGTPVITYNTGGSPEAIDEQSGFVVEKGDVEGLLKAIYNVGGLGNDVKNYCRGRALRYFNKDNCFNSYMELYDKLMEK